MPIDTKDTLCKAINSCGGVERGLSSFSDVLEAAADLARLGGSTPSAISNASGAWYAWLIALAARKYAEQHPKNHRLVKLPGLNSYDYTHLYNPEVGALILDFKQKLHLVANVNLVSSNPDFVIVRSEVGRSARKQIGSIRRLTPAHLSHLDEEYSTISGKCTLSAIVGYVGVKASLRPDRRIQLLHEGSLVKAVHAHLGTRLWLTEQVPLKFHALSMSVKQADHSGLRSVATHSITAANVRPVPAVDSVVAVSSAAAANDFFEAMQ